MSSKMTMALIKSKAEIEARKNEIVKWLAGTDMKERRSELRNGKGFRVNDRVRVQIGDELIPLTDFLKRNGIEDGDVIGDYQVRVNPARDSYPENFTFFMMSPVVVAPNFN